jgi:hypothetical protein
MTRWCPICESPGKPVLRGSLSTAEINAIQKGNAVRVGKRLPDIEPTHFCSLCPTFFRWRDRFYLTARGEKGVHGIGVWPHRQARVRIEMAADGVVFLFGNTNWILADNDTFQRVVSDFFWATASGRSSRGPGGVDSKSVSCPPGTGRPDSKSIQEDATSPYSSLSRGPRQTTSATAKWRRWPSRRSGPLRWCLDRRKCLHNACRMMTGRAQEHSDPKCAR